MVIWSTPVNFSSCLATIVFLVRSHVGCKAALSAVFRHRLRLGGKVGAALNAGSERERERVNDMLSNIQE